MARRKNRRNAKQNQPKLPRVRRRRARNMPLARVTECGQRYAYCVLDPLSGAPSKIPDGACASVLIEYDLSVSGVPVSGQLAFAAIPGLPCSAWGLIGDFTGPNREGVDSIAQPRPSTDAVLFPFKDFSSGVANAVAGATVLYNTPLEILSARIVSLKLEVIPTGPLLQQGGAAVTGKVPMEFELIHVQGDVGTAVATTPYQGASAHPIFAMQDFPPSSYQELSAFPDSKTCTGTEACVLMGMQSDDEFNPVLPVWTTIASGAQLLRGDTASYTIGSFLAWDQATSVAAYTGIPNGFGAAMLPSAATDISRFGNFWQPDECQALVWAGAGLTSTQPYTFRVRACMELCVSHSKSTYRPFVTPPEPDDPLARKHVRDIMRVIPSSLPKEGTSPGWWSTLTQAASGVATAVSELGIPVVSPIAGVARRVMNALGVG